MLDMLEDSSVRGKLYHSTELTLCPIEVTDDNDAVAEFGVERAYAALYATVTLARADRRQLSLKLPTATSEARLTAVCVGRCDKSKFCSLNQN